MKRCAPSHSHHRIAIQRQQKMPPLRTERPPWMPRTPAQYGAAYAAARADGQRRRRRANETFLEFILRTGHRIVPGCDWCEQRGEDCIMSVYSVRCFGCCRDTVQCSHNPDELASGRNVRSGGARGANRSARGRASVGIRPGYASRYLDDSEEDEYEVEPEVSSATAHRTMYQLTPPSRGRAPRGSLTTLLDRRRQHRTSRSRTCACWTTPCWPSGGRAPAASTRRRIAAALRRTTPSRLRGSAKTD